MPTIYGKQQKAQVRFNLNSKSTANNNIGTTITATINPLTGEQWSLLNWHCFEGVQRWTKTSQQQQKRKAKTDLNDT